MVHGIGPMMGRQLVMAFGSVRSLWEPSALQLQHIEGLGPKLIKSLQGENQDAALSVVSLCRQKHIGIICPDDSDWPALLAPIDDASLVLFVRGDVSDLNHDRLLAVVGAHKASHEGRALPAVGAGISLSEAWRLLVEWQQALILQPIAEHWMGAHRLLPFWDAGFAV